MRGIGLFVIEVAWETGSTVLLNSIVEKFLGEPLFMKSFTLQSKKTFVYSCAMKIHFGLNLYNLS